jgi:hypothetical protein
LPSRKPSATQASGIDVATLFLLLCSRKPGWEAWRIAREARGFVVGEAPSYVVFGKASG